MTEPSWSPRNVIFKDFDIENKKILDFGCGDKSILNYLNFDSYVGFDKNPLADYQIDFDKKFEITMQGDVGLVLGVLEYLESPNIFLETIVPSCKRFIIMVLAIKGPKYNKGWKRVYNEENFNKLIETYFSNYTISRHGKYLIADCTNDLF